MLRDPYEDHDPVNRRPWDSEHNANVKAKLEEKGTREAEEKADGKVNTKGSTR